MQVTQLKALLEPILTQCGLELDQCDVTVLGKRRVVRITVDGDGPQGRGPLLDDIAAASSAISAELDATAVMGETPYTLEVSSRGVSKPLEEPRHFRRNRGRLLKVWLADTELVGRIIEATSDQVRLDVAGVEQTFALGEIKKAVVQVELNRPTAEEE